jgi:alpha-L-fucosidase
MGDWMAVNGESIYGTTYGPIQGVNAIRSTFKRDTIFIHVLDGNSTSLEIPELTKKILSAHFLATGQTLKFNQTEAGVHLELPAQAPDANVSVIALRTS